MSQRSSSAASAGQGEFFQTKDLVWLDTCDEHRDEEIKQSRRVSRISTCPKSAPPVMPRMPVAACRPTALRA
ncbi:hypothetical protein CN128_24075 [Sinorhizobium meliloti]|nr:hypothetical protein CN202_09375 [Sinorhizobium meliloti]RVM51804.1 hypothetical protein CN128_24075 [Sinorhizobium meliloti]